MYNHPPSVHLLGCEVHRSLLPSPPPPLSFAAFSLFLHFRNFVILRNLCNAKCLSLGKQYDRKCEQEARVYVKHSHSNCVSYYATLIVR
jgi:hypothetical protein